MLRKAVGGVVMAMMVGSVVGTGAVNAQTPTWQDVQVRDIEGMHEKFRALAGAFDESQYDWQPMEGVRSVREVLGLAVAEAHLFPTGWGYDAPATSEPGFYDELERAAALPKAEMIRELDASFAFLIGVVEGMSEAERMAAGEYFGQPMPVHASVATAMNDMHEHLGQLIAYARANQVVPPWSRGND
ncbi:MAG: DinB family protein [Gemmatimonadetes bacterium]|nr:DinB family protein [Gemmatimonadota bacterium]NNF13868.1 DinB family protein [Gemmatimonadota bacterium]NNL29933.1 DinB family protein [Gemmatimonadota bacterium]